MWEGKYMGELVEAKCWTSESTVVSDDSLLLFLSEQRRGASLYIYVTQSLGRQRALLTFAFFSVAFSSKNPNAKWHIIGEHILLPSIDLTLEVTRHRLHTILSFQVSHKPA